MIRLTVLVLSSYVCLPTPLNESGPRIVLIQINFTPQEFSATDIFQYATSASEVMLMSDPYACINGVILVHDYAKATPNMLQLLTPSVLKNAVTYFEKTLPIRIKAIYFINLSVYTDKIFSFILQYLPEKLRERVSWLVGP